MPGEKYKPVKKRRKSKSRRNKCSSLSTEYESRPSSDESLSDNSEVCHRKRYKRHERRKDSNYEDNDEGELNTVWQNPNYKTQLSTGMSETQSQSGANASVEDTQSSIAEVVDEEGGSEYSGKQPDVAEAPAPTARKECAAMKTRHKRRFRAESQIDPALVVVHNQLVMLESRFQRDLHELEEIYSNKYYKPLLHLRNKLLEAAKALDRFDVQTTSAAKRCKYAPPDAAYPSAGNSHLARHVGGECGNGGSPCEILKQIAEVVQSDKNGKKTWKCLSQMIGKISEAMHALPPCYDPVQVPHTFWYHVFQRSEPLLSSMITDDDSRMLRFLRDVRINLISPSCSDDVGYPSEIWVKRHYPSLLLTSPQAPLASARRSVSLPSQSSVSDEMVSAKSARRRGRDDLNATLHPRHGKSDTCSWKAGKGKEDDNLGRVVGFEIHFEFYPNPHFANKVLKKRYVINVAPQQDDYVTVKRYNNIFGADLGPDNPTGHINDGGDEASTESEAECPLKCHGKKAKQKAMFNVVVNKSGKKKRPFRLLDYQGPRLVVIEGSTPKWRSKAKKKKEPKKRICCLKVKNVQSEESNSSSGASSIDFGPAGSFFSFFGWKWDVYRNQIVTNDGARKMEVNDSQIRCFVTKDYEVGTYIRDVVVPRAFAIYRSCKRNNAVATARSDSVLDSVSEEDCPCERERTCKKAAPVEENIVPVKPEALEQPQNFARCYDDVDDEIVLPKCCRNIPDCAMAPVKKENQIGEGVSLEDSRKKVQNLVKDVNEVITKANTINAIKQPRISEAPLLGTPLTNVNDNKFIPQVPDSPTCPMKDATDVSQKGGEADDENDCCALNSEEMKKLPKLRRKQLKRKMKIKRALKIKHLPKGCIRLNPPKSPKPVVVPKRCPISMRAAESVESDGEKEDEVQYRMCSNFPSDDNAQLEESDAVSSNRSESSRSPSVSDYSSEGGADNCPCEMHSLDDDEDGPGGRAGGRVPYRVCNDGYSDAPLCSMGKDFLKDQRIREGSIVSEDAQSVQEKDSFLEVSDTDSEAPPPLDLDIG